MSNKKHPQTEKYSVNAELLLKKLKTVCNYFTTKPLFYLYYLKIHFCNLECTKSATNMNFYTFTTKTQYYKHNFFNHYIGKCKFFYF